MRIFFLGNNWVAWRALQYLRKRNEDIVGLAVHPEGKRRYYNEIIAAAEMVPGRIFDGSKLKSEVVFRRIESLKPDIGLSILFDYILSNEFINLFPKGIINLHPSFLPYNRGQYPNVWSIVEGTPSGVTLHHLDEGIDTGDIIAQQEVQTESTDTGETLYRKLESVSIRLFQEYWPLIREGKEPRRPQAGLKGTSHITKDVEKIDEIHLDREYRARDLLNVIRARTFPPYKGAYFWNGKERIYLRIQLLKEEDLGG